MTYPIRGQIEGDQVGQVTKNCCRKRWDSVVVQRKSSQTLQTHKKVIIYLG